MTSPPACEIANTSTTELLPHLHGKGAMADHARQAVWDRFESLLLHDADRALRPPRRANATRRTVANSAYRRFLAAGAEGRLAGMTKLRPITDSRSLLEALRLFVRRRAACVSRVERPGLVEMTVEPPAPCDTYGPDHQAEAAEAFRLLEASLPPRSRVFLALAMSGKDHDQIAAECGVRRETVRKRLATVEARLHQLARQGAEVEGIENV